MGVRCRPGSRLHFLAAPSGSHGGAGPVPSPGGLSTRRLRCTTGDPTMPTVPVRPCHEPPTTYTFAPIRTGPLMLIFIVCMLHAPGIAREFGAGRACPFPLTRGRAETPRSGGRIAIADHHESPRPRHGYCRTAPPRAWQLLLLRDEEAAGSNPATPTIKSQVDGLIARYGDQAVDRLLAIRWRTRTSLTRTVAVRLASGGRIDGCFAMSLNARHPPLSCSLKAVAPVQIRSGLLVK